MASTLQSDLGKIAILGAGKLGASLGLALLARGQSVVGAYRRNQSALLPIEMAAFGEAQTLVDAANTVFMCVPDDAIASVCAAIGWRNNHTVIHCSGATELAALASAQAQGAKVAGFHPLRSFTVMPTDSDSSLLLFKGISIGIESTDSETLRKLEQLCAALGANSLRIPTGQRALYHASANYAGAFIPAVLQEAVLQWQHMGLSQTQALAALLPLLRSTVLACEKAAAAPNLDQIQPQAQSLLAQATVGPIARGDVGTVARHLAALGECGANVRLYCELSAAVLPLAKARGLDSLAAEQIAQLLKP